jgi:hypothetical protein
MDIKCLSKALSTSFISLLTISLITACGGGSSPPREEGGSEPTPPTGVLSTPEPVPTTTEETPENSLPFTGTITLDDYDWWHTVSSAYLGVIELDISPLVKRRVFSGSFPRKHASGKVVFRQPCGSLVHRIVAARPGEVPVPLTPCSSEIDNPGASPTNFEFSILSPDETKLAVEIKYYLNREYWFKTIVFNTSDQSVLAEFPLSEPAWLKDGRLLMTNTSDGLFITGTDLAEFTRLANGKPEGHIRNPAPHPDGNQIAFEMDQQIWKMNLDGSGLEVIAVGDRQFRFPEWSPDGSAIAYLGVPQGFRYDKAIYFTDLTSQQHYRLDVTPILDPVNVSNTISGPLSWSE